MSYVRKNQQIQDAEELDFVLSDIDNTAMSAISCRNDKICPKWREFIEEINPTEILFVTHRAFITLPIATLEPTRVKNYNAQHNPRNLFICNFLRAVQRTLKLDYEPVVVTPDDNGLNAHPDPAIACGSGYKIFQAPLEKEILEPRQKSYTKSESILLKQHNHLLNQALYNKTHAPADAKHLKSLWHTKNNLVTLAAHYLAKKYPNCKRIKLHFIDDCHKETKNAHDLCGKVLKINMGSLPPAIYQLDSYFHDAFTADEPEYKVTFVGSTTRIINEKQLTLRAKTSPDEKIPGTDSFLYRLFSKALITNGPFDKKNTALVIEKIASPSLNE